MAKKMIEEVSEIWAASIEVSELVDRWGPDAWVETSFDGDLLVRWTREETDAEEQKRITKEAKARAAAAAKKAKQEADDRALYEQLKERFG